MDHAANHADICSAIKPKVTEEDQNRLLKPFTAKEVRKAVFQMGDLKSPGLDEVPAMFNRKCWHLVKGDINKAILRTLNIGHVLREIQIQKRRIVFVLLAFAMS
ncbi:hypothetical protein vseg_008152 [Gypsophila vaccaria]